MNDHLNNIQYFVRDLRITGVVPFHVGSAEASVYDIVLYETYTLSKIGTEGVTVLVPDVPLQRVRCFHGQPLHHYEWLYVDGGSWWWPYALEIARGSLRLSREVTNG